MPNPSPDAESRVLTGARVIVHWNSPAILADVVLRAGRIEAIVPAGTGLGSERVDLDGLILAPAFGDGHVHPVWAGIELGQAPIRDLTSAEDVVAAVRSYAARHPDREWILGGSYDPAMVPGGLFDARWLDEACPDRPIALTSSDHHALWVNSEALRRAGIDARTPEPADGEIARRPDGEPLGTLREWQAMDLVTRLIPKPTPREASAGLGAGIAAMGALGITHLMEAAAGRFEVEAYLDRATRGKLAIRADLALRADPGRLDPQALRALAQRVDAESPLDAAGEPLVRARIVKFFSDGVLEAGTAAMLQPYADRPHSCGLPVWSPDELAEGVAAVQDAGFDVHIHAIGDAGIRNALDAIEASPGRALGRRATLAHVQVPNPDDLQRIADLGVIANFEPFWACWDSCQHELTAPRLGAERVNWQYPIRSLIDLGVPVSFGSDWPVSEVNPLACAAVAVTRTLDGSAALVPDQAISAEEALTAASFGVARQLDDAPATRLGPGVRADLIALDEDPREVETDRWPQVRVLGRWLAGERMNAQNPAG